MKFSLQTNTIPPFERIPGDDLKLFYYEICMDYLLQHPMIYDWDKTIQLFKDSLDIDICESDKMPDNVSDNFIRFTLCSKDQKSKPMAFFRHLRNAFAHFEIKQDGEWYIIKDYNMHKKKRCKYTFIGKIKIETLKSICFSFFDQREQILNNY